MDELKLKMQNVAVYSENGTYSIEQPVDCDITLPDYCTGIQRILKCASIPGIASVSLQGNGIKAEGSVTVRIIYIDENESLQTYDTNVPFAKQIDMQTTESVVFTNCNVRSGYMNSRAVTGRRVDVHGAVTLQFVSGEKLETGIVTSELPEVIQRKPKTLRLANSVADAGRFFHVTEVQTLDNMPPVSSVIRTTGYAVVNEIKVIKDKALIKGNLMISMSYTSPGKNGIFLYETKLQLSQIVDATGLDENEIIDTRVHLTQLNVIPKADVSGEYTLLDISAKLMAEMHAYREIEVNGVEDAYCTERQVSLGRKTVPMLEFLEKVNETFSVTKKTDISISENESVLDVWHTDLSSSYRFENGKFELSGSVNVCFLTESPEEGYGYCERTVDFNYVRAFEAESVNVFCTPEIVIVSQRAVKNTDGIIELDTEFSINANIFNKRNTEFVSDISFAEGENNRECDSAAIIYFASKDESVWDIARHYNTTVSLVMEENDLTDEFLVQDKMLLIPR